MKIDTFFNSVDNKNMNKTNPILLNPTYIYSMQCNEKQCEVRFIIKNFYTFTETITAEKEFERYKSYNSWYNRMRQSDQWIQIE